MSIDAENSTGRSTEAGGPRRAGWFEGPIGAISVLVRPVRAAAPREEAGVMLARPMLSERILFGKVSPKQVAAFCRQFSSYLEAGLTLVTSLESLRRQFAGTPLGPIIGRIALTARRGGTLTEAIAREPAAFDRFFVTMMRVAEARGGVPETLRMLAEHYRTRQRLVRQSRSALVYPAILILVALSVAALLTIFILPKIVDLMNDLIRSRSPRFRNFTLPWPTRWLIAVSEFSQQTGWWLIPTILVGSVVSVLLIYRTARGRVVLDEVLLHLPVVGPLARKIDTSRFARTISALLGAGIDIGSSLDLTAEVLMLQPMRRAVLRARESVLDGAGLGAGLEASRRFPVELISVVNSGEETGRLPEILIPLADDYDEQVEFTVRDLGNLIQPLILLGIGGVVLFIAVGFVMGYTSVLSRMAGG